MGLSFAFANHVVGNNGQFSRVQGGLPLSQSTPYVQTLVNWLVMGHAMHEYLGFKLGGFFGFLLTSVEATSVFNLGLIITHILNPSCFSS